MAVTVNIHVPTKPTGAGRFETEKDVRTFFSPAAEYLGFGTSSDGAEVEAWLARMCDTLRAAGA